jgi:Fic family protein
MKYNWQQPEWPEFRYDLKDIEADLFLFADKEGQISGAMQGLLEADRTEALLDLMIAEAVKTSEIEGEYLNRQDVASSIRNQLGLNPSPEPVRDLASRGIAELMIDVRNSWAKQLNQEKLFAWHKMLMSGTRGLSIGCWRSHDEPMQVVTGAVGQQKILFEAPPSERVPDEMARFFRWFNTSEREIKHAPVRSALSHLYFESIHPFEDGNGRIGRAIAEKALSQGLGRPVLLSLSLTIEAEKSAYYDALGAAQKTNEVTDWLHYFVKVILDAQTTARGQVDFILKKTHFFDRYKSVLNKRQLLVINRMLKEGPSGFEGGMNARKYIAIAKVSKATATRDLQSLVKLGIFIPVGGGRSTSYTIDLSL